MAGDYAALSSTWSGLGGVTTVAKLQAINALTMPGPASDLPVATMVDFIKNSGKFAGIASFARSPPGSPDATALLAANYLLALFQGAAGNSIPAVSVSPLLAILANISADARTGINAAQFLAFRNICLPSVPWWQANGFSGPVTLFDLMAAGNLS